MSLQEKLQADLKDALRSKDEMKLSTLRFLMASIHNLKIEKGKLDNEDIVTTIQKQIKQRKESIEGFQQGGRDELVKKEKTEMEILQTYLPEQLSSAEVENIVDSAIKETSASSPQDMGKVMGILSSKLKGKADMGVVSGVVSKKLS